MPEELNRLDRLTLSAWAIIHLHEAGEISEGFAMKLMNSPDRVSYRVTKEQCEKHMLELLAKDMAELSALTVEKARLTPVNSEQTGE